MEDQIIAAVEERHHVKLKEFQSAVCRKVLRGEDIFVCASTGSGKTFCFAFLHELFELRDSFEQITCSLGLNKNFISIVISPLSGLMVEQAEYSEMQVFLITRRECHIPI